MAAGSEGVLAVVGTGWNRLGVGEETGGGDNNEIEAGFGGGGGRGIGQVLGRRGGVSGSEWVKWSGMEQGGGQMIDQTRQTKVWEQVREGKSSKISKLRGTESSALIAAVLGWNSTTHY